MNFADGRVGELEDDIEVVDHEVEDDVDIESAWAEDAEAVGLEEHGVVDAGGEGGNGGIEALEVTDLDEALMLIGEADEGICLGEGGSDGLFDEHVQAGVQKASRYVVVG